MNNKMTIRILPIALCIFLFGIFNLITPHNGEYGDQATENILFLETFDEYFSGDFDISYHDFIEEKNKFIYSEYIDNNTYKKYGIHLSAPTSLIWQPELVKALPRMMHYLVYRIMGRILEFSEVFVVVSYLIFFLTFFYAFRFGQVFLGEKLGLTLAGVFVGNYYFNQLLQGSLEPQLSVFPFLLLMGLYGITKTLSKKSFKLIKGSLFFGVVLCLGFLNGYPNTQLILPVFLIGYLYIFNINLPQKMLIEKTLFVLLSIIFGIAMYFILAILYSISLGEHFLLHQNIFFIRIVYIFNGAAISNSFDGTLLNMISETLGRVWILISEGNRYVHAPHQPGMLLNLPFLNFIEILMLFIGIISSIFIRKMKNFRYFVLYLSFFFLLRAFTNNNTLVDKSTFDYYVLLLFPVAFGMYYCVFFMSNGKHNYISIFINLIFKKIVVTIFNINTNLSIFKKNFKLFKIAPLFFLLVLILTSSGINSNTFNNKYILEFDASLADFSGMAKVREFLKENASDSTLIIYNYSHGGENTMYRLDFMRDKRNLLLMKEIQNTFPSHKDIGEAIKNGKYSNIIIIDRAVNFRWGERNENLGYVYKEPSTNKYYSYLNPSLVTTSYSGLPTYWIYNIDKNNLNDILDIPNYSLFGQPEEITLYYDLDGNNLKGLDIPGNISKLNLLCDGNQILSLDNNERSFDYIHLDTDGSYTAAIYQDWNHGYKGGIKPTVESKAGINIGGLISDNALEHKLRSSGTKFFVNNGKTELADISMKSKINLPIDKVLISTPYYIFNDYDKRNQINISLSGIDSNGKANIYYSKKIVSDGSGLFGRHTYINGGIEHQSYDLSMVDFSDEDEINLKYTVGGESTRPGAINSAVYSSFHGFERSKNYLIMYGKKIGLLGQCKGYLTFNATSESFKKVSDLETYIGINYSL
jgi:hypothetical protein